MSSGLNLEFKLGGKKRIWLVMGRCLWSQPAPHSAIIRRSFLQSRCNWDSLNSITSTSPPRTRSVFFRGALLLIHTSCRITRIGWSSKLSDASFFFFSLQFLAESLLIQWVRAWCCSALCSEFSLAKVSYLSVRNRTDHHCVTTFN